MMKEKKLPHIVTAVSLVVFIVFGLACATKPPAGPPPTYRITTKPVASGYLQGKKAVIFNMVMAERGSASLQQRQSGGGIFGAIGAGVAIGRVTTYNKRAKKFDQANAADLQEALSALDELVATIWQRAYNTQTIQAKYDFGRTNPKVNFFNKPAAAVKREIADICARNNADIAVTIMQQVTHGYLNENTGALSVGTGKMIAITHIAAQICVFDRNGNVVIQAIAMIPNLLASLTYGYNFSPNDGDEYAQLYLEGAGNVLATILALDPSAAISMEGLIEGLVFALLTTDDDDDD